MEVALAVALAVVSVAAVAGWARRAEERARAQRLADEVHALRRAAAGHRAADSETTGSAPSLKSIPPPADPEPPLPVADQRLVEARRLLSRAEEALGTAEQRPRGAVSSFEPLRKEAIELLALLERVELGFSPIREGCAALAAGHAAPAFERPPASPPPFDTTFVTTGLRGIEDLSDAAARLRDDLGGLGRSTDRLREATAASSEALAAVTRGAEAIAPAAGALSGVANRVNLLALNLGVLVSPGAGQANVEEAGAELRSIFEEARRLARDVGAVGQRLTAAARAAAERGAELAGAISEERARIERGLAGLGTLDDLALRLRTALDEIRRAARECDEARARFHGDATLLVGQAETFAADVEAERHAAAAFTRQLLPAIATISEARTAAERTVRNLLAVADALGDRRTPGPEGAAIDAIREALQLLSGPLA